MELIWERKRERENMTQTQLEKEPLPLQGSKVYLGHCSYSNVALSNPSLWPLFHNYFVSIFHLGTRICSILGNFWEINKSVVISRDFDFSDFRWHHWIYQLVWFFRVSVISQLLVLHFTIYSQLLVIQSSKMCKW
jgi:hypothetical protein